MLLNIRHLTQYTYSQPVILGPHSLRLTPRPDGSVDIIERDLKIIPEPVDIKVNLESDGSLSHWLRFEGETKFFSIESKMLIRLDLNKNPFDFLIDPPTCSNLPMKYPPELLRELRSFVLQDNAAPAVRGLAFNILGLAQNQTVDFLIKLAQYMKQEFVYELRHTGSPYKPQDTLNFRKGSCRDWAVLYMAACQTLGLAARFVSGYYIDENLQGLHLHAWVEVYLPGAGWRGFDPSLGLACYSRHIALATAAAPSQAAPVQGTFKGDAQSNMNLELQYEIAQASVAAA